MKKSLPILLLVLVAAFALSLSACEIFQHKHTYSAEWSYDKEEHWLKATCEHEEEESSRGAHNFNRLNMCATCGYVRDLPPTDYTVTFDANGGEMDYKQDKYEVFVISVAAGEKVNKNVYSKLAPVLEGYEFDGWRVDKDNGKLWDFEEDAVNADTKLVASWKALFTDYQVNFYLNNGTDADPVVKTTVKGKVDFEPEREGYEFTGWWFGTGKKDSNGYFVLTSKLDENKDINSTDSDVNLYASWQSKDSQVVVLSAPNLQYEGGVVFWNNVEGAAKYFVRVTSSSLEEPYIKTVSVEEGKTTRFDLYSDFIGSFRVEVCSVGDGKTSVTSGYAYINVTRNILPSTTVTLDASTSLLTWTSVDNGTECTYTLTIDGEEVASNVSNTHFDMSKYDAGVHSVKIQAFKSSYVSSTTTKTVTKYKLLTPEPVIQCNSETGDFVITWKKIAGADKYGIQIGKSNPVIQEENRYVVKSTSYSRDNGDTLTVYALNSEARYIDSDVSQGLGLGKKVSVTFEEGVGVSYTGLYTTQYKLTLNDNYEGAKDYVVNVTPREPLSYYSSIRTGYAFLGWYVDKEGTEKYDFSATLTGDRTVYAQWQKLNDGEKWVSSSHNYRGSSNKYSKSLSGTTADRLYFTAYVDGEYSLNYSSGSSYSSQAVKFSVYQYGKSTPLVSKTSSSTSYETTTFNVKAGQVYCIEMKMTSTNNYTTGYWYISDMPSTESGGKPNYEYTSQKVRLSNTTKINVLAGAEFEITAIQKSGSSFVGWYNGEELVSTEKTLVLTASKDCPYLTLDEGGYTCKLTPKYSEND